MEGRNACVRRDISPDPLPGGLPLNAMPPS
jgi:hypothetical protein